MTAITGTFYGHLCPPMRSRQLCLLLSSRLFHLTASFVVVLVLLGASACGAITAPLPLSSGTNGGATAKASIEFCAADAGDIAAAAVTELGGCKRKLVVDITLDDSTVTGSVLETDVVVSAALDHARFPADEAAAAPTATPASTTTAAALASTLQVTLAPLRLSFRRGGVQMRYALNYLRDFPAALRERVRPLRAATVCDDGVTRCPDYTPLNGGGQVVSAPMGTCCLCVSVECAISLDMCNASMRAYFCFRTAAAATICVEEDGVRYGGWSIELGTPFYALETTVSGDAVTALTFQLSTDTTTVQHGTSRMQLLQTGDVNMAEAGLRLNVSQRVLFNPLSGDRVSAGASEWLLVPSALVTADGAACNKVGITPEYFYSLSRASQCNAQKGTCLANQLEDLRTADAAAIAQGGGGSYLASSLGSFTQQTVNGRRFLLDAVERTGGATLRWSINADDVALDAVAVPGSLTAVRFLAESADISAAVANPGPYAGLYYVVLRSCTATRVVSCEHEVGDGCITPLLVKGGTEDAVRFPMWPVSLDGNSGVANCTVELRDAANVTLDTSSVSWTLVTTTSTTTAAPTRAQRCHHCALHDLHCLFTNVCEWQMLVWTAVALVVTWCPYAVLASWRRVWELCRCV